MNMMAFRTIFAVAAALATIGNPVAAQECRTKQDYTIVGHDHGAKVPVGSATLCCTLCAVVPACRAAVYSNGYCQRKTVGDSHSSPHAGSTVLVPIPTTTRAPPPPLSRVWLNEDHKDLANPYFLTGNRVSYGYGKTFVYDVNKNGTLNTTSPYGITFSRHKGMILYGYIGPPFSNFSHLDAETLTPLWVSEYFGVPLDTYFSAANDVVVTNAPPPDWTIYSSPSMVVFNNTNGAVLWSLGSTALVCSNDAIVVTTSTFYPESPNNTVEARDILSGTLLFTIDWPSLNEIPHSLTQNSKASPELFFFLSTNNSVAVFSAVDGSFVDNLEGADASLGFATEDDPNGFFALGSANCSAISWEGRVMWTAPGNSILTLDKANPHVVYGLVSGDLTAYDRRSGRILAHSAVNDKLYSWKQALGVENGVLLTGKANPSSSGVSAFSLYRVTPGDVD